MAMAMEIPDLVFHRGRLRADLNIILSDPKAMSCLLAFNQISFRNRVLNHPDSYRDGVLRIYDYPNNTEHDFRYWSKGTPEYLLACLEQMEVLLQPNYTIGRVRIMRQLPKTNLGLHVDDQNSFRWHVPIITHENAFFVSGTAKDPLRVLTMPEEGRLYQLNTTEFHSSINVDEERERFHLVVNVLSSSPAISC